MKTPINSVANKAIETIDLASWLPEAKDIILFDLKPYLFKELILKEESFRNALQEIDWSVYKDKYVMIYCSNQAIIPLWADMLIASKLANIPCFCAAASAIEVFKNLLLLNKIENLDLSAYNGKRIVIKGCGDKSIDSNIYVAITKKLSPIARTIMYGEPCSMVPIHKNTMHEN